MAIVNYAKYVSINVIGGDLMEKSVDPDGEKRKLESLDILGIEQLLMKIGMLIHEQKEIESWINDCNKPTKYLWEHELGWLDKYHEINLIKKEIEMEAKPFICTECTQKGPGNPKDPSVHSSPTCYFLGAYRSEKETTAALGINFKPKAKRNPTKYRYDILMPEFIEALALIAAYGAEKYGEYNWQQSRLTGDKGPVNHMDKHLNAYKQRKPYDHLELSKEPKFHLAAVAFNAMMEYWYECNKENLSVTRREVITDDNEPF